MVSVGGEAGCLSKTPWLDYGGREGLGATRKATEPPWKTGKSVARLRQRGSQIIPGETPARDACLPTRGRSRPSGHYEESLSDENLKVSEWH